MVGTIRRYEDPAQGSCIQHFFRVTTSAEQPRHGGGVDAAAESHDKRSGRKVTRPAVPVLVEVPPRQQSISRFLDDSSGF